MASSDPNHPPGPYPPGHHIIPPPRAPSPSTSSYRLNHLMLRIKNPALSLKFYNDCFGLHTIFIFNTGLATIYYLGPRDTSIATLGTSKGLLELYHVPSDNDDEQEEGRSRVEYSNGNEYGKEGGVGFGHIGFTVPDVAETVERVKRFGFEVLKPLGEAGEVGTMGLPRGKGDVVEGYRFVFRQLAFVRDPDGYWVEIVPQKVKSPGGL